MNLHDIYREFPALSHGPVNKSAYINARRMLWEFIIKVGRNQTPDRVQELLEANNALLERARAAEARESVTFQMIVDAYVRGNQWAHENGLNAEGLSKAAYDYADKATGEPK